MQHSPEIVRIDGLVKSYRVGLGIRTQRVLDGVSFSVREGEIFGFVGPNGAGKTTTLKILMGLTRASAGTARILGTDVRETSFRRHVGFLPENPYFYDFLTAREILQFYARLCGVPRAERAARVDRLLGWVGLELAADARLRTYSKGMLQRVGIAQALVHNPKVVFLDEPMSGLDPMGRKDMRDIILRLRSEGKTIFMNTHILSDVETICDRIAIVVQGRIRYEGRVQNFLAEDEARTDIVFAYLPAHCLGALEEGYDARIRGVGERVEIQVPDKEVSRLLQTALAAGGEVISVTQDRLSLESIFMNAVGQTGEGDACAVEERGQA